jgi:hypothetical protein
VTSHDLQRLSQTRRFPAPNRPDYVLEGTPKDVRAAMTANGLRAVGKFRSTGQGYTSVPVVYVTKRRKPWYARHWVHVTSIVAGVVMLLAAGATLAILTAGLGWFLAGLVGACSVMAMLVRLFRGGGRSVSVTTTTTTKVR